MAERKSPVSTIWITFLMALLASVLVSSIPASGSVSSRPGDLRRNFALPLDQPTTRLRAAMASNAVLEVDALTSEDEKQDRADALEQPRVSFLIPCSFRKVPDRQLIAVRSILSLYHLRC